MFWIKDGLVAGRPGPDLVPWVPSELADAGFRSVLSVYDKPPDESELAAVGIRSVWHPLPLDVPPTQRTADRCCAALPLVREHLQHEVESGRAVLVHCLGGCDRTGLTLAFFLMKENALTPQEAISDVRRSRPEALSMDGWEELAVHVLSELTD